MDHVLLSKTAAAMVARGKGILAADESSGTCEIRFKTINTACTEENRHAYRGLLFATPGVEKYISGVILFDETTRQKTGDGTVFTDYLAKKGVLPGIKVDTGAKNLALCPGEKVTEGLDGLREGVGWSHVIGAALLCGVGFTMSLFIGSLAFEDDGPRYITESRLGILAGSLAAGLAGYLVLRFAVRR